jgi:Do/DeqQ family serine protease
VIQEAVVRSVAALIVAVLLVSPAAAQQAGGATPDPKAILESLERAFVSVAERVMPAVVHVSVTPRARERAPERGPERRPQDPQERMTPPERREFERRFREFFGEGFERFFRQRPPERRESRSQGSGVIVDKSGIILTNNHLIEESGEIEVRLSDKRKLKARVVGRDPKTDLAVLRIEGDGEFPVAELGDSDRLRIGQWAIAVGNPFGLDRTVTVGIISATGRQGVGVATYESFIQTDAAINPGNSGGPLVNLDGKVIGINTAIVSVGQGIGFAIPTSMARRVMPQLLASGRVTRGWLGIRIQPLTEDLAQSFGTKENEGVLVADVMPGGPAEAGGLKAGDVILDFEGQRTAEVPDLQRVVADTPPGKAARVTILREGKRETREIRIGEMPGDQVAAVPRGAERWGLTVQPVTPELARQFNLSGQSGVIVSEVEEGSPAARAGVRPGDVVLEVNRRKVGDVQAFEAALGRSEQDALLLVQRDGRSSFLVLKAEPR